MVAIHGAGGEQEGFHNRNLGGYRSIFCSIF
jgi:hypothetical protein